MVASLLHLLFEFLAFKSDIEFWKDNKSLAGLSARSVISELFSQMVIFLFLLDSETSLLVTIPAFLGIGIQCWKVKKATGFCVELSSRPPFAKIRFLRFEEEAALLAADLKVLYSFALNLCLPTTSLTPLHLGATQILAPPHSSKHLCFPLPFFAFSLFSPFFRTASTSRT